MKPTLLTLLICLLSLQTNGTTRGAILCDLNNKKASLYINHVWDEAEQACKEFNLPMGLLLAMSILESGYGESDIAKNKCNYVGLKCGSEYCDYPNLLECFRHWGRTLTQDCYKELDCDSLNLWLYQLEHCGYHGTKNYSKLIKRIYYRYNLNMLDNFNRPLGKK